MDAQGRVLGEPSRRVDPARLLRLEPPPRRGRADGGDGGGNGDAPWTTLEGLPPVVDGGWWRRHADLLRARGEKVLELKEGRPAPPPEEEEAEAATPPPDEGNVGEVFDAAFEGIVGQDACLERLRIEAQGGRALGTPFPHTLFAGPPGTGKTTLARGVAACAGARLVPASGPTLRDIHGLTSLLASLRAGDALFLDEIHAMGRDVLEVLYEAMAEGSLTLTLRSGVRTRTVRLELPPFTLLAATTEPFELPRPLLTRFALRESLGFYEEADLARLATRAAAATGIRLVDAGASVLAAHARGTPREVLRLVERLRRDVALRGTKEADASLCRRMLERLGYDAAGLSAEERRYLGLLRRSRDPIPLGRLARMLGMSARTLLDDIEPWLCRWGLVRIGPRGRRPGPRLAAGGGAPLAEGA